MYQRFFTLAAGLVVLPFAMAEETELDAVKVHGDPLSRNQSELTQPVHVITGDELDKRQSASIGELLSQSAGIHNNSYGSAVGRPVIRGLGGGRVKVMQNGIDSLDVGTISPDHAVAVDTQHATQVEVVRGPAALIFGNGAVGGAVNVVDERIPVLGKNSVTLGSELSSVDDGKVLSLHAQRTIKNVALQLSASQRDTEAYEVPHDDHPLENSDVLQQNFNLGVSTQVTNGTLGFAISRMENEFGLPGHDHHEEDHDPLALEEEEELARVKLEQTRFDMQFTQDLNLGVFTGLDWKLGWVDYQHEEGHGDEEHEAALIPAVDEHDHGGMTQFKRKGYESRLGLNYQFTDQSKGVVGVQLSDTDFSAEGGEAIVPDTQSQQVGVFALHSVQWTSFISTDLAARFERNAHDTNQGQLDADHLSECGLTPADIKDRTFENGSVSAGINWQVNSIMSVRSNVSQVSRSAGAQELYSCGPHEATQTFEIGNSQLDNEISQVVDLGILLQHAFNDSLQVASEANVYRTNMQDFIYSQNLGVQTDGFDTYQYQQQDAFLQGYEVQVTTIVNDAWQLQVFADGVRAKFEGGSNDGDYVPRMPADRVGFEVAFQTYLWQVFARQTHYQDQTRLSEGETATKGFDIVSLGASVFVPFADSELKLYGQVQNLLDEEVRYHTSFVKDDVLQPGRNLKLGVQYRF